jgi:hypothetical protein
MKRRAADALAFGGAAGAIGVSAVLAQVLCPGSCVGCGSCVASIAPMASAAVVLGAALAGPKVARAVGRARAGSRDGIARRDDPG